MWFIDRLDVGRDHAYLVCSQCGVEAVVDPAGLTTNMSGLVEAVVNGEDPGPWVDPPNTTLLPKGE